MILITGATGTVGSAVANLLRSREVPVRLLSRRQENLLRFQGPGVELHVGDMAEPSTLRSAVAGVRKVFLLARGLEQTQHELNVLSAAMEAGVEHVVKLSAAGADAEPSVEMGRWHKVSEDVIRARAPRWTLLRPSMFMTNTLLWRPGIESTGSVYQPRDGATSRFPVVDPADVAAVAVSVLTEEGHHGQTYELTGPELLSAAEQVAVLAAELGRPIALREIPIAVMRDAMVRQGMPERYASAYLEYQAVAGRFARLTDDVERLLGRPARSFSAWVRAHAPAFGVDANARARLAGTADQGQLA